MLSEWRLRGSGFQLARLFIKFWAASFSEKDVNVYCMNYWLACLICSALQNNVVWGSERGDGFMRRLYRCGRTRFSWFFLFFYFFIFLFFYIYIMNHYQRLALNLFAQTESWTNTSGWLQTSVFVCLCRGAGTWQTPCHATGECFHSGWFVMASLLWDCAAGRESGEGARDGLMLLCRCNHCKPLSRKRFA